MKVLILGDATSPHIIKWANSLHAAGVEIWIFSLKKPGDSSLNEGINVYCSIEFSIINLKIEGAFSKLLYVSIVPHIRYLINKIKPDILHAHYASSYGLLGALTGFHPYIISIWGGDVISFPQKSFFHKILFKYNLKKADKICSTSRYMTKLLLQYTSKIIEVIPFGIDVSKFKPGVKIKLFEENYDCLVGTIKGLEWYYGLEYLIEAFQLVTKRLPEKKLKLLIVGGGSLEINIKKLIKDKMLEDKVLLTGKIKYSEVHQYHNLLDIFVAVSVYEESFGVSVLEAASCEKPVIVSRVGGMMEVVEENRTGFVVPARNPEATADKIEQLIKCEELRIKMGKAGRQLVKDQFELNYCLKKMIMVYEDFLV